MAERTEYSDDEYEAVGKACKDVALIHEYWRIVGPAQSSYYRFGMWLERNYIDVFLSLLPPNPASSGRAQRAISLGQHSKAKAHKASARR